MSTDNNVLAHLKRLALEKPDNIAIYAPTKKKRLGQFIYTSHTYKNLNDQCNLLAKGLLAEGVNHGTKVVLMVTPSFAFFVLVFALFKVGAIPILIDPGMGLRSLKQCLKETAPDAFIGSFKAHLARVILGWERGKLKHIITVGGKNLFCRNSLDDIKKKGDKSTRDEFSGSPASDTAAIIFTSGSTGPPKGAVFTHQNFSAMIDALKNTYDLKNDEIDLCTFPLFGLIAPALDMVSVIPVMDFTRPARVNPDHIFSTIEQFEITNLFGSPALIRRITKTGLRKKVKLKSLRRVISAGAPVPVKTLQEFSELLKEETQVFTPYGATEALPVTSVGSHKIIKAALKPNGEGKGIFIGCPVEGIEVFIIKITDDPIDSWNNRLILKNGEIGEVVVSGPQVTERYLNRDDANRLNKIRNLKTNQVYHRMGDLAYQDKDGQIWFCGRKSQRIITEMETLFTIPLETIFNNHPAVYRSALVGVTIGKTQKPVIIIETEKSLGKKQQKQLQNELLELTLNYKICKAIKIILFYKNFPVDIRHNAKINREKLGKWAAGKIL
ncbi:MAG: AMP-binding protein [Deltaproteobacteria bacterium]|nr:AMP-binding protein [Deltaproteobacteria bacterium]